MVDDEKVITMEERIPKLKEQRRQKANRRFILYISVFFILILVVVYFQSSLSTVDQIQVSGNHYVSSEEVIKAARITGESGFWDVKAPPLESKIESIGEIESATVEKQFPNDILISVQEFGRIAYLKEGIRYFPILENGYRLDPLEKNDVPVNAPLLVNWKQGEQLERIAVELSKLPEAIIHRISEIRFSPSAEFPGGIIVYMTDGFEVWATTEDFAENMKSYPSIVEELGEKQRGIIHMRVSIYFESYKQKEGSENEPQE